MDHDASFGRLIRDYRLRIGLSQAELAGRVGCATITLRKIETDLLRPSMQMAERLAVCLEILPSERPDFIRLARRNPKLIPQTIRRISPTPTSEEIGTADLCGRAVHGYDLGERIGTGGFGVVYRAFQPAVERDVAIKIILPKYANHPEFIRRFESEARLIAHLEHPHIVPLYDYWREPNAAYLVMRWLRGGNLGNLLLQGSLDPGLISRIIDQICAGLYTAHRSGIVHRDIKPANILLDEDHNAYLGDFGIAKITAEMDPGFLTDLTEMPGSPISTSPEQIRYEPLQPQVDIYCLGLLLFEMFTGKPLDPSTTPNETLSIQLSQSIPDLTRNDKRISEAIHLVIETATAKDPGARYADIPSFLEEFHQTLQQTFVIPPPERLIQVTAPDQPENPYKGLRAFDEADANDFFGREVAVRDLLGLMSEENDLTRFAAIVGPSGSGKSSLVMAGLIPALRRGGLPSSENWFITQMTPGSYPMHELELALQRVAVNDPGNLSDFLMKDDHGLLHAVQNILPDDNGTELVLVVDQFEELFTLAEDEGERSQFLKNLVSAVIEPGSRIRLIITLRADYIDRPLQYVDFGEILSRRTIFVLPLTPDELERVIVAPARRAGLTLEVELVQRLIEEVGDQPGAMPLLEYALTELFERRSGRILTLQSYLDSGGVSGALANRAEYIFAGLADQEKAAARQLFLRLVTPNSNGEDTRRRVIRNELKDLEGMSSAPERGPGNQSVDLLLEQFNRFRLLTFDRDPISRSPTVEVAHEALLSKWPRLHNWIEANRRDLIIQRQLNRAALEWVQADRDPSFLLRGSHLDQIKTWNESTDLSLTKIEKDFLDASIALRQAEQTTERERELREARLLNARQKLRQAFLIVLMIGLVAASVLAAFAMDQRRSAQKQAAVLLASQAETELKNGYGDRAVLLALETLEKYPYVPQAERALGRAISYNRAIQECRGHTSAATSIAWSPDGTRLASTSSIENHVIIWNAATCQPQKVIDLPKGITSNVLDMGLTVKWSPDGKRLLILTGDRYTVGSQDYVLILLDVETEKQISSVKVANQAEPEMGRGIATVSHYVTGAAVEYSPDGKHLATLGGDNTALVWDADLKAVELVLVGHQNDVNSIAWSPDGGQLVTASLDGTARTWDGQTGKGRITLQGHNGRVNQAAWSPDGRWLATAGEDARGCIWKATNGELFHCLEFDGGPVWTLAWSPDSARLVTGHEDAGIRIWDAGTGKLEQTLSGHSSLITHLAWSTQDQRLASADNTGGVRIWNAALSTAYLSLPYPYSFDMTWSPEGRYVVIPAGNFMVPSAPAALGIWDVIERKPTTLDFAPNFKNYPYTWLAVDYSPDQKYFLVRGSGPIPDHIADNSEIYALDAVTGKIMRTFSAGDDSLIRDATWSPDGLSIAATKTNGKIVIWDFQTGKVISEWLVDGLGNEAFCNEVEWSKDGKKLAAGCGKGIARVWDVKSLKVELDLVGHEAPSEVLSIAWSPDNTRLLTTSGNDEMGAQDTTARIWDAKTGKEQLVIHGHSRAVWRGAWSPDGSRIVTGSLDDTTRVWNALTGDDLLTLSTPTDMFAMVEWSPDGKYIAVGGWGMKSEVWRVWQSTSELITYAKGCCVFRSLTNRERQNVGLPLNKPASD